MYERFEQLLQENDVSTYKVSKATGIAQSVFSAWKKGISTPKTDKLQRIADYFHVPLSYLVGDVDYRDDDATISSDLNAFKAYVKSVGWNVFSGRNKTGENYYVISNGQISVNVAIDQFVDFENKIRNECVNGILGFVADSINENYPVAAHQRTDIIGTEEEMKADRNKL